MPLARCFHLLRGSARRRAAVALGLLGALALPVAASASPPNLDYNPSPSNLPAWWGTNGRVTDIVATGGRVYLAGGFDYVGPSTGYGVGVDGSSGKLLSGAPLVDGVVRTAVPDGSGGWYIGGSFTHVGGVYRPSAAQVTANGAVTKWNPKPKGTVYALAVTPSSVVIGGEFTQVGSTAVAANRLGAVDRTGGAAVAGWSASASATVRALAVSGSSVFVGGDFTAVNGAARTRLAKIGVSNGALDATFHPTASASVTSLQLSPSSSVLYGGGSFTSAGDGTTSVTRYRLAAWNPATGALTSWAPSADNTVEALAVNASDGTVYAGGLFGALAGVARARLGGLSPTGGVTGLNAALNGCNTRHTTKDAHTNPACTPEVSSLAVSDGTLYVGGRFGASGSTIRHDAAAYNTSNGNLIGWNPVSGDRVLALAPAGSAVFVGGEMTSVNGGVRKGIAALDAKTGALDTSFAADTNNEVLDLQLSADASRLFLAGSFTTVQGQARSKVASIVTSTGSLDTGFKPTFNNDVFSIGYGGGAVFAGGQFTTVNGVARSHTVKLSPSTGAVVSTWVANTVGPTGTLRQGGMVQSLAVKADGSLVFLGGPFTTVNGTARAGGIAVVSGTTGALNARQLGGVLGCSTVGPWIIHLYLSADGKRLYGGDVCPDNIYQWDAVNLNTYSSTGLLWRTGCDGGMQGVLEVNGDFYYGTHGSKCRVSPTSTTTAPRQRYAVFSASSGALLPDTPSFDSPMGVWSFAAVPDGLLVGGDFTWVYSPNRVQQGLVLFT
ncbi:MAG TPA: hypothetical protein VFK66_09505, partial [Oryzihumus sp.]|nr:hypothetical protein [Oryzihumus sp.]